MLTEAFKDDKAGPGRRRGLLGRGAGHAAGGQEFKKVLIVEPAVADSITGTDWNRYIFRTGRNSSQDAISNAVAIAKPGVSIATLAQDYAFGRDGVKAYKEAAEAKGAKVVHEEYVPINTTDFTAPVQRIIQAMKDQTRATSTSSSSGPARATPWASCNEMKLEEKYGIKITSGGNILDALKLYKPLVGMEGAIYYYYEIPKNPINDWLVKEHQKALQCSRPISSPAAGLPRPSPSVTA